MTLKENEQIKDLNSSGFTLIEVLIALTLFIFGVIGVSMLHSSVTRGSSKANLLSTASALASGQAEHFRTVDFDSPDFNPGEHGIVDHSPLWVGWSVIENEPYRALTQDSNGDPLTQPYSISKTIDITVFSDQTGYSNPNGNNRILTYRMIKSRHL
jgi:prepilin-type N-terminal cleavage/methylation domain-containing protein